MRRGPAPFVANSSTATIRPLRRGGVTIERPVELIFATFRATRPDLVAPRGHGQFSIRGGDVRVACGLWTRGGGRTAGPAGRARSRGPARSGRTTGSGHRARRWCHRGSARSSRCGRSRGPDRSDWPDGSDGPDGPDGPNGPNGCDRHDWRDRRDRCARTRGATGCTGRGRAAGPWRLDLW